MEVQQAKAKVLCLVQPCKWNEMLELNRMAFDDYLPKYSESRCIAISIKLIKKNAPHIKWILSFSDGTQCGDGTIYRASGFALTAIKDNKGIVKDLETGECFHKGLSIAHNPNKKEYYKSLQTLVGNQLRYIYLIDKTCKITVPILPFSKIDEMGAGMYKGTKGKKRGYVEKKELDVSGGLGITWNEQKTYDSNEEADKGD
jgi:hypothetical protein